MSQKHREAAGKDAHKAALHCCHPTEQGNQCEHKCNDMTAETHQHKTSVFLTKYSVPLGWNGCNNGQAGVCEVQRGAGGSEMEDQSVPDYHWIAVCHYFSPILQMPAPA